MNRFYLPQLNQLSIYDYSLYNCPIIIDFSKKLNIIYGTNGVGKSTLLMILLFSIVGPYRGGIKTKVRQEQRKDNRPIYEESFFKDRMTQPTDDALVVSEFTINRDKYVVTHSLTNGQLIKANVNGIDLSGKIVSYRTYEMKYSKQRSDGGQFSEELEEYLIFRYHEQLKTSSKLPGGVNTLISMLLDVMFFDEGRKLTFWNSDLQETIVGKYIVDSDFYEKYCEQKLSTKALESAYKKKSETFNFMSKFFEREKKERDKGSNINDSDLRTEFTHLEDEIEKLERLRQEDQAQHSRKSALLLDKSREEELLKEHLSALEELWYSNLFPSQYNMYHKRFSKQMIDEVCPICGNHHRFNLETRRCIMCNEPLALQETPDILKIDIERRDCQNLLMQCKKTVQQVKEELDKLRRGIDLYRKQINELNVRKNEIETKLKPDDNHTADSDTKRLDKAKAERNEALRQYNEARILEEKMRKTIEDGLVDNFTLFRTTFLSYSSSFFGASHTEEVSLPFSGEESLGKLLIQFELDGKKREESYMLSESQRIFTDLAFRFSILTTFHDNSFFICETPDSTLDVFHEEQAVKTFERYIHKGNSLILSANARLSSLISSLYQRTDKKDVSVVDLTQLSRLALPADFSFNSYIRRKQNEYQ